MRKPKLLYLPVLLVLIIIFLNKTVISQVNWMTRAPLPNELTECGSVVLNGKIYIIGGLEPGAVSTTKVHVYDPVHNSWSTAAPLPMALHHMPCVAYNGKIYVLGGYTSNPFQPVSNTYEYNPIANIWISKAPVPTVRGAASAAEIGGKIYVIGGAGYNLTQSTDINEAYDPVNNTWETKAPMSVPRDHHSVVALDTMLYSVGGRHFSANIGRYKVVEAYMPLADAWILVDSLLWGRAGFSLVAKNGKMYSIGGEWFQPGSSGLIAQIEVYDPKFNNWEYLTNMNSTRHGMGAGVVGDTIYTISGGIQAGFSYSNINEAFIQEKSIGIEYISSIAKGFTLYQNYPNPFNPATKIKFDIPDIINSKVSNVKIEMYNLLGENIATLVNQNLKPGSYEVSLNASAYPSGVYFYKLSYGELIQTKKMMILK